MERRSCKGGRRRERDAEALHGEQQHQEHVFARGTRVNGRYYAGYSEEDLRVRAVLALGEGRRKGGR